MTSMTLICTRTCGTCRKTVDLLEAQGIDFEYREYTQQRLSAEEIEGLLAKLAKRPVDVLRVRDANRLGIDPDSPDAELIEHMAREPTLLQRPIAIVGDEALVCRPAERVLELLT